MHSPSIFLQTRAEPSLVDGRVGLVPVLSWLPRATDTQMVASIGAVLMSIVQGENATLLDRVLWVDGSGLPVCDLWVDPVIAGDGGIRGPRLFLVGEAAPQGDRVTRDARGIWETEWCLWSHMREGILLWPIGKSGRTKRSSIIRWGGEPGKMRAVTRARESLAAVRNRALSSTVGTRGRPVQVQIGERPQHLEATVALIRSRPHTGPFALDALGDGVPCPLDLNPRFLGPWTPTESAWIDSQGANLATRSRPERRLNKKYDRASTASTQGLNASWRPAREVTSQAGRLVPAALSILTVGAIAQVRTQKSHGRHPQIDRPTVAVASSEPWLAGLQWGAALGKEGVLVKRFTVPPKSSLQRARQRAESVCFAETVIGLRDDGGTLSIADPALLISAVADIQMTEHVLAAMIPTDAWLDRPDLHHIGPQTNQWILCDKHLLMRWGKDHGIPVPKAWPLDQIPDMWPVIAKPSTGYGGVGVRVFSSPEELAVARREWSVPMIVQEWLSGPQVNVGGVAANGEVLAIAAYEPLPARSNPAGPPVAMRVLDRPDALDLTRRVLASMQYTGPFCLDMVTASTGELRLLDLNARVFGSWTGLQRAGLDLISAYLDAIGVRSDRVQSEARIGEEYAVDIDLTQPFVSSVRGLMVEMTPLTGLRGILGQVVQWTFALFGCDSGPCVRAL